MLWILAEYAVTPSPRLWIPNQVGDDGWWVCVRVQVELLPLAELEQWSGAGVEQQSGAELDKTCRHPRPRSGIHVSEANALNVISYLRFYLFLIDSFVNPQPAANSLDNNSALRRIGPSRYVLWCFFLLGNVG